MNDSPSAIDLRAWRQFLAVAETLHYGQAAARLNMTQPPLTLAIQQLERRLGVVLFDRTRRSVALAPAGRALVDPVRQLLQQADALPAMAHAAGHGDVGSLRLGFVSTVGYGTLPRWLRDFREAHPQVDVVLREATSDVQLRAFEQGEADAGFVLHAPGMAPRLPGVCVGVEPLVLALPEASPLAQRQPLPLAEVLVQPLIVFPRAIAPSVYDALLAFYHRHGASPVMGQEAVQMQTIVNLVSAGLGIAWVPQSMVQLQRAGVVYREVDDAPRCETRLVWPDDAGPVVTRFVAHVTRDLGG